MELHYSYIVANSLHILNHNLLAVDVEAQLLQLIGNLQRVYATVDDTRRANLCSNCQGNTSQLVGNGLSSLLNLGKLHGLLTQVLCQHLLSAFAGDNGLACRNKIVASVTRLNIHDIVLVTQADNIFFQNNFHKSYLLL